jgi:hypothetical protein
MADQHDILVDIKRVASELGRPPTRKEYLEHGRTGYSFEKQFGTWSAAIKAAFGDIPKKEDSTKKMVREFFSRSVDEIIKQQSKAAKLSSFGVEKQTLCIPDLHCPWVHQDSLTAVFSLIEVLKPDRIIQLGDAYDFFSWSSFPKSSLIINPYDELTTARKQLEDMWYTIRKIVPHAELHQITGNHSMRPMKRVIETCPELEVFMDFKKWFQFDGVQTTMDPRETLIFEGVAYTHGHKGFGKHSQDLGCNVVHGHTHQLGLTIRDVLGKLIFEMQSGYLGDHFAPCFGYMPKKINNHRRGITLVGHLGPVIIPLE